MPFYMSYMSVHLFVIESNLYINSQCWLLVAHRSFVYTERLFGTVGDVEAFTFLIYIPSETQ